MLRVFEIYRPFCRQAVLLFLFLLVGQVMGLASPYIHGKIIDAIISHRKYSTVIILALVALGVGTLQIIVWYLRQRHEVKYFDFDVRRYVSRITLEKVMSFSVGQHLNENSGVKKSVIDKGEHSLAALAYTMIYDIIPLIFQVVLTIAALIYISVPLGLIVFAGAALFVAFSIHTIFKMRPSLKKLEDLHHDNNKLQTEMIRHIGLVQISAQEKRAVAECDSFIAKIVVFGKEVWTRYMLSAAARSLIVSVTQFTVIALGAYYVYSGVYTAGYLVVFIAWSSNVFGRMGDIGSIQRRVMESYAATKKYFVMLDVEPDIKVMDNPVALDDLNGRIEFKDVSFRYPVRAYLEDEEKGVKSLPEAVGDALMGVSFVIEAGQRVAFVGPSGAGKTTIAHLLLRAFDPVRGQITIDGNDLRVIDLTNFRQKVGLVEQDVVLFDDTLRYNLTFGLNGKSPDATDEMLHGVAALACIDKFYHRLEKGFDTIIGEKGVKLSGGERQRVGIGRAMVKDPRILIFDEATSNLDAENERLIRYSIENVSRGRTTILIAHRLSTIKDVDRIFVLDKGRLVGSGRHDELMQACEVYRNLVGNQLVTI